MELITNNISVTSLQIAEWSGKPHSDMLKSIRKMMENVGLNEGNFSRVYLDAKNQERPMFVLPKKEVLFVVSKFNDKLRWQVLNRIEELEAKSTVNIPQEVIEQFVPKSGFLEENDKGMLKTEPVSGYFRADMRKEENRLLQQKHELQKNIDTMFREEMEEEVKLIEAKLEAIRLEKENKLIQKGGLDG